MREIICCGGSNTSFRRAYKEVFYNGIGGLCETNTNNSYPEIIHKLYGNKIYNLGVASNSVNSSVLSIISLAEQKLKEGVNISIIFNCSDFQRPSLYFSKKQLETNSIFEKVDFPYPNNYLFTDDLCGFYLFGGIFNIQNFTSKHNFFNKVAKTYSDVFSIENSYILGLSYLLLLQNFCKLNNIPYKIFFDFDFFSQPITPFFKLDKSNPENYFKSFFIEKQFTEKKYLAEFTEDPYVNNLFKMLDLNNIWFLDDENCKYGGLHEWIYRNNEYVDGESLYIPLYLEDIYQNLGQEKLSDETHKFTIESAKEKMKKGIFFETAHPTYYYWEKFVKEVMITWNLF